MESAVTGGSSIDALSNTIIAELVRRFPVCLSSDEFHFFPQAPAPLPGGPVWDDFSAAGIGGLIDILPQWDSALSGLAASAQTPDERIDAAMLSRVLKTLGEQLTRVRFHETQPTFYLTILAIGLAEALDAGKDAWDARIAGLPRFLEQACENLGDVPELYMELGLNMLRELRTWLDHLGALGGNRAPVVAAFDRLERRLQRLTPNGTYRLAPELYALVARDHIGCGMSISEIGALLDAEVHETAALLEQEAAVLAPGNTWQAAVDGLAPPAAGGEGSGIYRTAIDALGRHCRQEGLVDARLLDTCPVRVVPVPAHMAPVRSAAAYSMAPGHPPRGGTFYITAADDSIGAPKDWRLLAAHETFPGHHLMDAHRWQLARPVRRHIEFPLFYEGWASFSEELLFDTGFFHGPEDRLLMAKRRFWRAMRGRVELDIQTGRRSLDRAAAFLADAGMPLERAAAMVRRYALKPGYQLCYTVGRTRFRRLYDRFVAAGHSPVAFARTVLEQGEIGLDHLEGRLFGSEPGRGNPHGNRR